MPYGFDCYRLRCRKLVNCLKLLAMLSRCDPGLQWSIEALSVYHCSPLPSLKKYILAVASAGDFAQTDVDGQILDLSTIMIMHVVYLVIYLSLKVGRLYHICTSAYSSLLLTFIRRLKLLLLLLLCCCLICCFRDPHQCFCRLWRCLLSKDRLLWVLKGCLQGPVAYHLLLYLFILDGLRF